MSTWNAREAEALATIGLLAAQADGRRDEAELKRLADVFESFGVVGVGSIHARVALGNAALEDDAGALVSPEARDAAWELAVGVCHADGVVVEREQAFLDRLRGALRLDPEAAAGKATAASLLPVAAPPAAPAAPGAASRSGGTTLDEAAERALDEKIRQAAILAGALELLPQGLATLGIVPVQLKLVADVGTAYGHRVDAGHARELLATVGLGISGQAVEGFARRFLGHVARRFAGRGMGALVNAATGAAATFAATWAIGEVAKSWYASGRTLDAADVQERFTRALEEGRAAFGGLQDAVEAKARSVSLPDLSRLIGR
jgi:uncharacterized protein (DUF697 family)/tellurite resistance protein